MKRIKIIEVLKTNTFGINVNIKGWVRTSRRGKDLIFVELNDGSTIHNIQIVIDTKIIKEDSLKLITTGACISVNGNLIESEGGKQAVEVLAENITILGAADPKSCPLQKKGHSFEFLREIAHLRPRTNTFGAIFRIRHHMSYAIHKYFNDNGFYYFHTPIITASDAEGAGAMFQVTTLDFKNTPHINKGEIDYKEDFFGQTTNLTVSGQLEGELGAMALGAIYTFGPTFRAENSNTPRHLAEFWMVEPEVAFYNINDNMNLALFFQWNPYRYYSLLKNHI